jgi:hypothetical protein
MPKGKLIHFSNDHINFIKELQQEYDNPGYTFISKQLLDKFGQHFSPWSIKNVVLDIQDNPKLHGGDLMQMAAKKVKDSIYKGETMQRQGTKLLSSELSDITKKSIIKKPDYSKPTAANRMRGGNNGELMPIEEHEEQLSEIEQKYDEVQDELDRLAKEYENVVQQSVEVLEILKYYNKKLLPVLIQNEEMQLGLQDFMKRARKEIRGVDKECMQDMLKDICIECLFSD